ncbi:MAG: PhoH family protein [Phycisphaerae bacterium]
MTKTFVLDTNVLLHNPNAIHLFDDNEVIIPFDVLEELDKFKTGNDDLGRNARHTIRLIDGLRVAGKLSEGVAVPQTGGMLKVQLRNQMQMAPGLIHETPDNRIISTAWTLQQKNGRRVVFVTKDINARIKADALGIKAEDFEAQKVDFEHLYTGYREAAVPGEMIDTMFREKKLDPKFEKPMLANEFALLKDIADPAHTAVARADAEGMLSPIKPRRGPVFGVMPRNLQQTMALDLLMDRDIQLVTLLGSAGTGKTLLALAAGMSQMLNDNIYQKLLAARPIMPLGRDIGYLPGDKDEKLQAWMQPIFDNLGYLLGSRLHDDGRDAARHASLESVEKRMQQLLDNGQVVMEPLTYIRGRSIPNQFMIVDEAQNLTPHEVKTIVTRVGEGTKLVLTGDATQIDNPYLDSSSNGLSYLVERLKNKRIVAHITLAKSERSELARLVTDVL